jgi:phage baseplate assembly protein W
MAIGIGPALPLVYDQNDGPFRLTKSTKEAVFQNFKNLVMTNPGERVMDPDFGVGIREYLFELESAGFQQDIIARINQQVSKYLPNSVRIVDVRFTSGSSYKGDLVSVINSNSTYFHILFEILPSNTKSILTLPVSSGL